MDAPASFKLPSRHTIMREPINDDLLAALKLVVSWQLNRSVVTWAGFNAARYAADHKRARDLIAKLEARL